MDVESAATGSAYRALKLLVESTCGDPALLRCGLEKVWAEDGTVESKERFVREGAGCLIWNRRGSLEPNVVEVCGRMGTSGVADILSAVKYFIALIRLICNLGAVRERCGAVERPALLYMPGSAAGTMSDVRGSKHEGLGRLLEC